MKGIEKTLNDKGIFVGTTEGSSMEPMIKTGTKVIIVKPHFPLKKGDVPVYRRGGHYSMHRIIKVFFGRYIICGDNRKYAEFSVRKEDIVGILVGFYFGDMYIDCLNDEEYLSYTKKMCAKYPKKIMRAISKKIAGKRKKKTTK